jgi:hypothetical protein
VQQESALRTAIPALVGMAAFAASVLIFYPGFQSFDSAYQFWQARTGHFSNQSPVVMTALWSAINAWWPSPAALLIVHLAAYWLGVVLLASAIVERTELRAGFILLVGFLPPPFVILGHLWTDSSLIAAMTLGFGLTVVAFVHHRILPLILALPVIVYAGAVRHNSLAAIVPLALLWAAAACEGRFAPARRGASVAIAAVVVVGSFAFGRVLDHSLARDRVTTWALVAGWDLAALSVRNEAMLIPEFDRTPGLTLAHLRRDYSTYTNVPLFVADEHVRHGMDGEAYSDDERWRLARAWGASAPGAPARIPRAPMGGHVAPVRALRRSARGLFFTPSVVPYRDNPPPPPVLWPGRERLIEFVRAHRGSFAFAPIGYLAIALAGSLIGWTRRRTPAGTIALALGTSGLLLVLPLVVARRAQNCAIRVGCSSRASSR